METVDWVSVLMARCHAERVANVFKEGIRIC